MISHRTITAILAGLVLGIYGSAPASAETLTLGYIGSLTGGAAQYGLAGREALKIAADEVNAQGGFAASGKQYQIKLVPYDDQQKPAQAVAAYQRLVNVDGAKYVFLQNSASTLAIEADAESDGTVLLTAAFSPKVVGPSTKYTFRIYLNGDNLIPGFTKWLKDHIAEKRVVTLNPNDETGWGYSETIGKAFTQNGFTLLASQLYERTQNDFAPLLTKLIALGPDLIDLGTTTPGTGGLIVRQARELGYKGRFVQTGGPGWDAVVAAAGKDATEGMITLLYADPGNAAYQKLVGAYSKSIGQAPNELVVPFYDAAHVLIAAIQAAGGPDDTSKVAEQITKVLPMPAMQGEALTAGHQQILPVDYIAEIKDGKPSVIGKLHP